MTKIVCRSEALNCTKADTVRTACALSCHGTDSPKERNAPTAAHNGTLKNAPIVYQAPNDTPYAYSEERIHSAKKRTPQTIAAALSVTLRALWARLRFKVLF